MKQPTPIRIALFLLCLIILAGCNPSGEPTQTVSTPAVKTPQELVTTIDECVASAQTTYQTLKSDHKSFRVEILRGRITDGLAAIEELVAYPDANSEDVDSALCAKSALLYFGAIHLQPEYVEELSSCAEQMLSEAPDSEACRLALGRWLDFKFASQDAPFKESLVTIADYARLYPRQTETVALFSRLSHRLVQNKEFKRAKQALTVGDSILEDAHALDGSKRQLAKNIHLEKRRAAKKAADRKFQARVASVIGGRRKRHYVLYSEDPKTRRCNYKRCFGFEAVVDYAKNAEDKKWKWEHITSYPDTHEGFRDATNKVTLLYRQNTTISWGS